MHKLDSQIDFSYKSVSCDKLLIYDFAELPYNPFEPYMMKYFWPKLFGIQSVFWQRMVNNKSKSASNLLWKYETFWYNRKEHDM